jgi:hypothetical protein
VETSLEFLMKKKKKKVVIIIMCFKIIWLQYLQGKSCWIWLELYTLFGKLHFKTEHFWLMIFGYFINAQILKLRLCIGL